MTTYKTIQRVRLKQVCDGRIKFAVERISRPKDVYDAVLPYYKGADREILSTLCLNSQNQPTCFNIASMGSLNTTRTRPVDILKVAILSNALGLVMIHNHPSGNLEPSPEDLEFTRSIEKAGKLLGIELYDHLIVTDDRFMSFRERGLIS